MLIARWLWAGDTFSARMARFALIPPALLFRFFAATRVKAYQLRLLKRESARAPTIAVGNLTVGGSGKTPIAAWIAEYYARRGIRPGIVLRGYGGDEGDVHRNLVSNAIVVENPNRLEGAREAISNGARVVVLDDAYQRLDIKRDLNIAVVSAESRNASRWTLPAGPWRESWCSLRRADLVIVSRKRASRKAARIVVDRVRRAVGNRPIAVANLGISHFRGLTKENRIYASQLRGARVVAAAGIADPYTFADQCRAMGAEVKLFAWSDHHNPSDRELRHLMVAARSADYVVITEKDAVKVRDRWPSNQIEPLVAQLNLTWEVGEDLVQAALDASVATVDE